MKINAVKLKDWIDSEFKSYSTPPVQQKEEIAQELGIGVATLYRWLKEDNRHIEAVGSGDDGYLIVWKMDRVVTP